MHRSTEACPFSGRGRAADSSQGEPADRTQLGFALAAIPPFIFCLEIALRRISELAGFAPNLGTCLCVAVTAACLFVLTTGQRRPRRLLAITLLLAGIASLAAAGFHQLPDAGFDAQSYHLPSVLRLLSGWKPMVEAADLTLSNSYPSGIWTILGGFDAIFGFESGRALLPILMISALASGWTMFRRAGFSAAQSRGYLFLLVANPVALSQIFTAFSDGVLYELALIFIASLMMMIEDFGLPAAALAGATMILLCNTKLTGLYFAALALLVAGGLLLGRPTGWRALKDRRRQISVLAAAGLLAAGFVGWRPYVTNVLEHGAVLYPPASELGYRPGSASQVPPNLDGAGRPMKIAALILARTNRDGGPTEMKIPGTLGWHELRMSSDTRNGGFGPFFGAMTVLAFASLGLALITSWPLRINTQDGDDQSPRPEAPFAMSEAPRRTLASPSRRLASRRSSGRGLSGRQNEVTAIGLGATHRLEILVGLTAYGVLTTVLFPEPWWARFVPAAWMAPLAASWLAREIRPSRFHGSCVIAVIALALLNAGIAITCAVSDGVGSAADIEQKLEQMIHVSGPVYLTRGTLWNAAIDGRHAAEDVWRRRLFDRGKLDVVIVPREQCREIAFLTVDVQRCAAPPPP